MTTECCVRRCLKQSPLLSRNAETEFVILRVMVEPMFRALLSENDRSVHVPERHWLRRERLAGGMLHVVHLRAPAIYLASESSVCPRREHCCRHVMVVVLHAPTLSADAYLAIEEREYCTQRHRYSTVSKASPWCQSNP